MTATTGVAPGGATARITRITRITRTIRITRIIRTTRTTPTVRLSPIGGIVPIGLGTRAGPARASVWNDRRAPIAPATWGGRRSHGRRSHGRSRPRRVPSRAGSIRRARSRVRRRATSRAARRRGRSRGAIRRRRKGPSPTGSPSCGDAGRKPAEPIDAPGRTTVRPGAVVSGSCRRSHLFSPRNAWCPNSLGS